MKSNAAKLASFTDRARYYQRLSRQISREMRDLDALRTAYTYMTEHTIGEYEELKAMIEALEEAVVLDLQINGMTL
jgi:TPP-dependent pyruvate/acetoin dehydrogenase alpha subunit